ncbi:MAG: hypothetical protein ABIP12_07530 [Terriglobales bacterium]
MTEVNKTPEAVTPNEVKPNDATPVPEKGNVAPIDSAAPKAPAAVEGEEPAESEKERKQA